MGIMAALIIHVHANRRRRFLYASFQDVINAKLPGDRRQIFGCLLSCRVDGARITESAIFDNRVEFHPGCPREKACQKS